MAFAPLVPRAQARVRNRGALVAPPAFGDYRVAVKKIVQRRVAIPPTMAARARVQAARVSHAVRVQNESRPGMSQFGDFGFSLKKVVKNVGKAVGKAVVDTGHAVGKVADSKIAKGIVAAGLAATGVGVAPAAAIMAAQGAAGGALKKGGGLKKAARGAATGAATGAAAGVAGKVLPKVPGLSKPLTKLRGKASTTVLGKIMPKSAKRATSYDATSKLDTLATQPLPEVAVTPSLATTPTLISPSPDAVQRKARTDARKSIASAARKELEAGADRAKGKFASAARKLRGAAEDKARAAVTQAVTEITTPPSANGVAPQGGFPAIPETAFPDPQAAADAKEAGGLSGILAQPVMLGLLAIGLYAITKRK